MLQLSQEAGRGLPCCPARLALGLRLKLRLVPGLRGWVGWVPMDLPSRLLPLSL